VVNRDEVVPLSDELLPEAGALLAQRHARALAVEPRQGRPDDYAAQVARDLARGGARGLAAVREGRLVAYLVVRPEGDDRMYADLASTAASDPAALRPLYAALAQEFADRGVHRHVVLLPDSDRELREVFTDLAFGVQYRWAVQDVAPRAAPSGDIVVRPSTPADLRACAELDRSLVAHQRLSPSFSGLAVPAVEAVEAEWADTWDEPEDYPHLVAERDGRVVGTLLLYRRPPGDLRVPDESTIDLAHAATDPDSRGTGVMTALLAEAMTWSAAQGLTTMTIDWRTVNLLSSSFWSGQGFRPTFVRMYRAVP
jgi:GNAT superfamily N-acetyltransferase